MGSTGWGGTTVRRLSGLTSADGAWDTEAVPRRLAELAQRRDELAPRFERLATRLSDARERLAAGLPPDQQLDAELAATRAAFVRLYTDARAMADALDVTLSSPEGAPTLPDVTAVLDAIETGLRAELDRQARRAAARHDAARAVLNRVARISYRGPAAAAGFGPLRAWQGRAEALRAEIAGSDLAPPHPEIAPLSEGTNRFNHLLDLIDGLPTLDEPDYRRLVNAVAADFDEALARAAGRGLLVAVPA
jgi:hypothetical protein